MPLATSSTCRHRLPGSPRLRRNRNHPDPSGRCSPRRQSNASMSAGRNRREERPTTRSMVAAPGTWRRTVHGRTPPQCSCRKHRRSRADPADPVLDRRSSSGRGRTLWPRSTAAISFLAVASSLRHLRTIAFRVDDSTGLRRWSFLRRNGRVALMVVGTLGRSRKRHRSRGEMYGHDPCRHLASHRTQPPGCPVAWTVARSKSGSVPARSVPLRGSCLRAGGQRVPSCACAGSDVDMRG